MAAIELLSTVGRAPCAQVANEKLMYEIAQENKKLSEPLSRALKEAHGAGARCCGEAPDL